MKRLFFSLVTLVAMLSIANLYPAELQQTLKVKTIKYEIEVPFTSDTTIAQIKETLHEMEGIPVDQQKLVKEEGLVFSFPPRKLIATILEDDKTCSDYDLQHNTVIKLFLRSRDVEEKKAS